MNPTAALCWALVFVCATITLRCAYIFIFDSLYLPSRGWRHQVWGVVVITISALCTLLWAFLAARMEALG